METRELETELRMALVGNEELMEILPNGERAIYHLVAPSTEPKKYPIIVYSPISDVPALSGDNREVAHRVTIRIHVIASQKRFGLEEEKFKAACRLVKEIMTGLKYIRRQTTPYVEEGKLMMIFDYVRGVES